MTKAITYIFFILMISDHCSSQSNNYFEKISLKFNEAKNSTYSTAYDRKKVYSRNLKLSDLIKSNNDFFKKSNYYGRRSDSLQLLKKELNPKYPLWLPVSEVVGMNLGLGAFNAYVTDQSFAQVSFKTIQKNFQTGAVWDHDHFVTNFFAHPYHGNIL